jgi:hypothetical protein
MLTKTVRSRFPHEVGQKVEGCTILEKKVIIPPNPVERRLGVFDYLVEVPPAPVKPQRATRTREPRAARPAATAPDSDFTRATPEERHGGVIRRVPSR